MWLCVEGQWTWYRRSWRSTLYSSGLQPLMFLGAMGLGFGSQVEPGPATQGESYLHYVAPALLVSGAVLNAITEASYPILSSFKWQRDYVALTATPITPEQALGGRLLWIGLRLAFGCVVYAMVAALLNAWTSAAVVLALPIAVATGLACAAPVAALAASTYGEGTPFIILNRFVVVPMTLFSGTFFPISDIPLALRPLAWLSPLWHGNELARGLSLEHLSPLAAFGHVAFLAAVFGAGLAVARRRFRRRLEQ